MRKRSFTRGFLAGLGTHFLFGFGGAYVLAELTALHASISGAPNPLEAGPFELLSAGWFATQVLRLILGTASGVAAAHWGRAYSWATPAALAAIYFFTAVAMAPNDAALLVFLPWLLVDSAATLCGAFLYMRRFEQREA